DDWTSRGEDHLAGAQLVLVFGGTCWLDRADEWMGTLRGRYPDAVVVGCSTAGEIIGESVVDDGLVATAVTFDQSRVAVAHARVTEAAESKDAGLRLARSLDPEGLVHVFVLSDGLNVNGSELVSGLTAGLPAGVTVTGGLSGDGGRFTRTLVIRDDKSEERTVTAVGLYGERLRIGYGSLGGWDPFGPERRITRSEGNVLYELDGRSALELYKSYLGEHAADLPASGLLFPLSVRTSQQDEAVVRTILGVDDATQSLTFAGDVPVGSYARLMRANFNRLLDGAAGAARSSQRELTEPASLAVLISCVGRKMVLKQRVEEEVEAVREVIGEHAAMAGFYSYGEISPFTPGARCDLHNQTMTITTFTEV
ncbi:MAG TPA: hypothetical protein ENK57_08100, partial [Polyangiaceae bacterium]|nr:hypothetical protein [Polyangiaceae bacterium]